MYDTAYPTSLAKANELLALSKTVPNTGDMFNAGFDKSLTGMNDVLQKIMGSGEQLKDTAVRAGGHSIDMFNAAGVNPMSGAAANAMGEVMADKFALPMFQAESSMLGKTADLWGSYPKESVSAALLGPTTQGTILSAVPNLSKTMGSSVKQETNPYNLAGGVLSASTYLPTLLDLIKKTAGGANG
jgi:hypothetical protein